MATLVNASLWIYFLNTEDADRVKCKICKKTLISKRSFNLKQHLKQSHKIEVRPDKRLSKVSLSSSNEIITLKGANFWAYFTNSDSADRVTCKICSKALKSNNDFNLRQHLKYTHNLEIRLEKKISKGKKEKKLPCLNETTSYINRIYESPSFESRSANNAASILTLDSNDSYGGISTSSTIIDIKQEFLQDVAGKDYINTMRRDAPFHDSNRDNKTEKSSQNRRSPSLPSTKADAFVDPLAMSREHRIGFNDPLNSPEIPNNNGLQSRFKKKISRLSNDGPKTSSKNESFEQWVKKKKQLLEIEEFEMKLYKVKLELWEREQHLHLARSKFTKDIRNID